MRILRILLQLIRRIGTDFLVKHIDPRAGEFACGNTFLEAIVHEVSTTFHFATQQIIS